MCTAWLLLRVRVVQVPLDQARKFLELAEALTQHPRDDFEIDCDVVVHEHIAEARDLTESRTERRRQYVRFRQTIDRGSVVRRIETGNGDEMGGDIDRILGAELEPALDRPAKIDIRA